MRRSRLGLAPAVQRRQGVELALDRPVGADGCVAGAPPATPAAPPAGAPSAGGGRSGLALGLQLAAQQPLVARRSQGGHVHGHGSRTLRWRPAGPAAHCRAPTLAGRVAPASPHCRDGPTGELNSGHGPTLQRFPHRRLAALAGAAAGRLRRRGGAGGPCAVRRRHRRAGPRGAAQQGRRPPGRGTPAVVAAGHPLAMWVDYWELSNRLADAQQDELDAFYARWPGTYVEDRLRNDWLLELGRRRDWAQLPRRVPALSHERRPRGQLLRAAHRAPGRPGRARRGARGLVRAARRRRRLPAAGRHAVRGQGAASPPTPGARRAWRSRPTGRARRAGRRRAASARATPRIVADARGQPGALPARSGRRPPPARGTSSRCWR